MTLRRHGVIGGVERVKTGQQPVAMGYLEQGSDAIGNTDHPESTLGPLARRKQADYRAQTGRVHVGNIADIQNNGSAMILSRDVLEFEQCAQGQGAGQLDDLGALGTVQDLDFQVFRTAGRHSVLTIPQNYYMVVTAPPMRASGSTTVKVEPRPSWLSTVMPPCIRSTTCLTIDRPRPVPPTCRERALSTR